MSVLKSGEVEVASETDVRGGTIGLWGVNDAFDLYLVRLADGNYKLIIFMNLDEFRMSSGSEFRTSSGTPENYFKS